MLCTFNFHRFIILLLCLFISSFIVYYFKKSYSHKNILLIILFTIILFSFFYCYNCNKYEQLTNSNNQDSNEQNSNKEDSNEQNKNDLDKLIDENDENENDERKLNFHKKMMNNNNNNWELYPDGYDQLDANSNENLNKIPTNNDINIGESNNNEYQESDYDLPKQTERPNVNITYNIKYVNENVQRRNPIVNNRYEQEEINRLKNQVLDLKKDIDKKNVYKRCNVNYPRQRNKTCPITIGNFADYESLNNFANMQKQDLNKPSTLLYNPFISRGGNN